MPAQLLTKYLTLGKALLHFKRNKDFFKKHQIFRCATEEMSPTSTHEDGGSIPGLAQWVGGSSIALSSGVG